MTQKGITFLPASLLSLLPSHHDASCFSTTRLLCRADLHWSRWPRAVTVSQNHPLVLYIVGVKYCVPAMRKWLRWHLSLKSPWWDICGNGIVGNPKSLFLYQSNQETGKTHQNQPLCNPGKVTKCFWQPGEGLIKGVKKQKQQPKIQRCLDLTDASPVLLIIWALMTKACVPRTRTENKQRWCQSPN